MSVLDSICRSSRLIFAGTVLAMGGMLVGCQPSPSTPEASTTSATDDHDHEHGDDHDHDHSADIDIGSLMPIEATPTPENLADGVGQLVALRDTVAKGFAADDVDSIHDQLHSVGNLLECIESFVESGDMSSERKKEAGQAVETLFDAYGGVDAKLHGQKGSDYADVKDDIDSAVETLRRLVGSDSQ